DRFAKVAIGSGLEPTVLLEDLLGGQKRDEEEGDVLELVVLLDAVADGVTGLGSVPEFDGQDDRVGPAGPGLVHSGHPVLDDLSLDSPFPERLLRLAGEGRVAVDDQDTHFGSVVDAALRQVKESTVRDLGDELADVPFVEIRDERIDDALLAPQGDVVTAFVGEEDALVAFGDVEVVAGEEEEGHAAGRTLLAIDEVGGLPVAHVGEARALESRRPGDVENGGANVEVHLSAEPRFDVTRGGGHF